MVLWINRNLYLLVVVIATGLFLVALGPGLFEISDHTGRSWQHRVFRILCHQQETRSYSFNGAVMAVCSRCLGIYGAFLIGVLSMRLFISKFTIIQPFILKLMGAAIVLNVLDVIVNAFGIWTNTLHSRLLFGAILGITVAWTLASEFYTNKQITEQ